MSASNTHLRPYLPHGAARKVWECKAFRVLSHGPAGTGKTFGNLAKLDCACRKYPGMRGLIVRKVKADVAEILKDFEDQILHRHDCRSHTGDECNCIGKLIVKRGGDNRAARSMYLYPNGSEIIVGGMNKASRIMGPSYDMIVVIEGTELTEEDCDNLASRLRNGKMPYQQMIVDCNPRQPQHHLWTGANATPAKYVHFPSTHKDNPKYWDHKAGDWTPLGRSYVLGILNELSGVRRAWFLEGKWQAALGIVYDFDPKMHVINTEAGVKPFNIPPDWRRIRTIDFGLTNPFVCQWWGIDPDGRMYLYREIYRTRRIVEDHAREIMRLSAGERIEATIADHDAEGRATLERYGIPTVPAIKDIVPGIQKVMARLRTAGDGKPRMFLVDDALGKGRSNVVDEEIREADPELVARKLPRCTRDEFESYVYPEEKEGKASDEIPIKLHDHGMDATRYGVVYLDGIEDAIRVFPSGSMENVRSGIEDPMFLGDLVRIPSLRTGSILDAAIKRKAICCNWTDNDVGPWRVWGDIEDETMRPPQAATYSLGACMTTTADGYAGVICASKRETREQVAEAVITDTTPEGFARLLAMAGYWFGGQSSAGIAFVLWEGNTPGTVMGRELLRLAYPWVYFHTETDKRGPTPGDKYGWKPNPDRAQRLLIETRKMLAEGAYRLHSDETAAAAERLVMRTDGVGPWDFKNQKGGTGAEIGGDTGLVRARCAALSLSAMGMESCQVCNPPKRKAARGTFAAEEERVERERAASKGRWWSN